MNGGKTLDTYYDEGNIGMGEGRPMPAWGAFLVGGIVTFLLVYIGVARPLAHELTNLRDHVRAMEKSLQHVAGQRAAVGDANSLLMALSEQQTTLGTARNAVQELQQLQRQLLAEARQTQDAMAAVAELAAVKDTVLANADRTTKAADVVATSEMIWHRLSNSMDSTYEALEASNNLLQLSESVIMQGQDTMKANSALSSLVQIKDTLNTHQEIDVAQDRVSDLLSLKDRIVDHTSNLAEAIETLEISSGLAGQIHQTAQAFEEIRHWMVEVAASESLLQKARTALQPITELGNLRYLSPDRLRSIAKNVSEQYETRLASKPDDAPQAQINVEELPFDIDDFQILEPSLSETDVLEVLSTE